MNSSNFWQSDPVSRRSFLKTSTAAAATLGVVTSTVKPVFAAGSDTLRVGLIGCGSRGTGAAMNCIISSPGVEITALGDVFPDKVERAWERLKDNTKTREWDSSVPWTHASRVKVTRETCFSGFDAYQKVISSGIDLVILAGPPHFRPAHLKAAVEGGKHVFMEKPVAVDPAGVRLVIASSEVARQKGLSIVAGTQRRHQPSYVEVMKRLRDGALGEILAGECYWNGGCVRHYGFYHPRQKDWTEMEYQLRNWYFYTYLSGDHIVEQHVHNLDVINWAMGSPPVEALGTGGRQWRVQPEFGNIYDHFAVRYRYANGAIVTSMARQIDGTDALVFEAVLGSKGRAVAGKIEGQNAYNYDGLNPNPYEQEHADLIASIRDGKPLNEGRQVAESTLTAIMGRMSAYTGQPVKWDWVLNKSKLDLTPKDYKLGDMPIAPVAMPGETELI
jgi:myo-inositol 2-dehydrogenase / D-chiro-inositol 1-dehydrogenase